MNERIKELVGQAKFMAEETINRQISKNAELDAFAEKFAELIVKECADVANNKMKRLVDSIICEEQIDTEVFVGNKIKHHFGVEE